MSNANTKKVLLMQKKAIRTISNVKYNDHNAPLFLKHQILPYNLMQKQFILTFMHGIEYGYGQESFTENWPKNAQRGRAYELRNGEDLFIPRCNKESLRNAPLFNFPILWNALDINVKLQINRTTFKFALLNSLFGEIHSEAEELVNAEVHSH
jgi:hypothetical protein